MDESKLAEILKDMHFNSPEGETATMVHLFGVQFAREITDARTGSRGLAKLAGIPGSYGTEIDKGRKLAKYVSIK